MTRRFWVLTLAMLAACAATGGRADGGSAMLAGRPVETLILPDVPVTDATGVTMGFTERYGRAGPLLIGFTYTTCGSICPIGHAILAEVDRALGAPGAPPLRIVTISIDPAKDTPERLAAAALEFEASPRWDWVVASGQDAPALLDAFGVPPGPPEFHDPLFLLGDLRDGRFRRIVGLPDPTELLALAGAGS